MKTIGAALALLMTSGAATAQTDTCTAMAKKIAQSENMDLDLSMPPAIKRMFKNGSYLMIWTPGDTAVMLDCGGDAPDVLRIVGPDLEPTPEWYDFTARLGSILTKATAENIRTGILECVKEAKHFRRTWGDAGVVGGGAIVHCQLEPVEIDIAER